MEAQIPVSEILQDTDNPFKFLEAYTKEDDELFLGRHDEIEKLYDVLFSKNIVLVYGESGAGKTSVIQCGLANRFKSTDWLDVWITRKNNLNDSLRNALVENTGSQKSKADNKTIPELIQQLYLRYFKPIYLIVDQLEELFILGSAEEKKLFFDTIELILESNLLCKIILVIQEKYHSFLHEVESRGIPLFQSAQKINRLKIEDAVNTVATSMVEFSIEPRDDSYEGLARKIVAACKPTDTVHPPDLQVFLYVMWQKAREAQGGHAPIIFTPALVEEVSKADNVLKQYLADAVTSAAPGKEAMVWLFLQQFVTAEGTRTPVNLDLLAEAERKSADQWIQYLIGKKIIRKLKTGTGTYPQNENFYILVHDSLAPLIASLREKSARPPHPNPPLKGKGNPYKGLESYNEEDTDRFFGRKKVAAEWFQKIHEGRLLAVVGASGTGKSSLIKAGIIPQLRDTGYFIIAEKPTAQPYNVIQKIKRKLAENEDRQKFVIYIDQFEELSSQCESPEEREAFLDLVRDFLEDPGSRTVARGKDIKVLLSIRSDYENEFDRSLKDWRTSKLLIPPFSEEDIREIIVEPAYNAGLEFQPAYLVDIIVKEVMQSNGSLPLLSYTLNQMYEEYETSKRAEPVLTEADYNKIGGVVDGLRFRANAIYEAADAHKMRTIRNVMLRMVSLGIGERAGKKITDSELEYSEPEENVRVKEVLKQFADKRLIIIGKDEKGNTSYEPAHDSLVRAWDLIGSWINTYGKELLFLQRNLGEAVIEYENYKKLWHEDPRLDQLKSILNSPDNWLNKKETHFVLKSIRKRQELIDRATRKQEEELEKSQALSKALTDKLKEQQKKDEYQREILLKQEELLLLQRRSKKKLLGGIGVLFIFLGLSALLAFGYYNSGKAETEAKQLALLSRDSAEKAKQLAVKERNAADRLRLIADSISKNLKDTARVLRDQRLESLKNEQLAKASALKAKKERDRANMVAKDLRIANDANVALVKEKNDALTELETKNKSLGILLEDLRKAQDEKSKIGAISQLSGERLALARRYLETNPALAYQIVERAAREDTANAEVRKLLNEIRNTNTYFEIYDKPDVRTAFFTKDGKMLIALSGRNVVDIWSVPAQTNTRFISSRDVHELHVSPDVNQLMIVSSNNIMLHNISGERLSSIELPDYVTKAFYSATGDVIALSKNSVDIFSPSGQKLSSIKANNEFVLDANANSKFILVKTRNKINIYDLEKKSWKSHDNKESYLLPDAKGILSFEPPGAGVGYYKIKILDNLANLKKSSKEVYPIQNLGHPFKFISWISSSDDFSKATILLGPGYKATSQSQAQLEKGATLQESFQPIFFSLDRKSGELAELKPPLSNAENLVVSPDGKFILGSAMNKLSVYNFSGEYVQSFGGFADFNTWAFNPSNNHIILTRDGSRARIWEKGTPVTLGKRLKKYSDDELKKVGVQ